MIELYEKIDEMEGIIKVLKVVNQEREIVIGNLVAAAVEKDKKIEELKLRIETLEGVTDRSRQ